MCGLRGQRIYRQIILTTRWAQRARRAYPPRSEGGEGQHLLFGIAQGGFFKDLRRESIDQITSLGFDGYALGGLSVGESKAELTEFVYDCTPLLPASHPRYLMGVGTPFDIINGIAAGLDMFDCVSAYPQRPQRNIIYFARQNKY